MAPITSTRYRDARPEVYSVRVTAEEAITPCGCDLRPSIARVGSEPVRACGSAPGRENGPVLTPKIREFLVELEDLMDRTEAALLDRDRTEITTADAIALVRLAHRTDPARDVELQVDDREVVVSYGGEPLHLRDRAFALQFIEALLGGRMDIEVHHGLLWRTTRSFLDESPRPFLVTRMPIPTLSPRRERRSVGFGAR